MDALVKRADARTRQTMEYNRACLYARLAEAGPKADQERHAAEAVKCLNDLLKTNYFERQSTRDHLDKDPDLTPLRSRADFQEFVIKAKAVRPKSR